MHPLRRRSAHFLFLLLGSLTPTLAQPSFRTPVSYEAADQRAGELLAKFSTEQKLQLISGSNGFFIKGFPEFGMPDLFMSDATGGVNIRRNVSTALEKSTAFPNPLAL